MTNEQSNSQYRALNPQKNIWVTASAGSGKTKVLTDRISRLMLEGFAPQKILCLTFTKKAVAEMQERLGNRLERWNNCSLEELTMDLTPLLGRLPDAKTLNLAKKLHSLFINEPVQIQTFHGFCHTLLQRFLMEANVFLPIKVLDERQAMKLWDMAYAKTLKEMDPESLEGQAALSLVEKTPHLKDVLTDIYRNRLTEKTLHFVNKKSYEITFTNDLIIFLKTQNLTKKERKILEEITTFARFSVEYINVFMTKENAPRKNLFINIDLEHLGQKEQDIISHYTVEQTKHEQAIYDADLNFLFGFVLNNYNKIKEGALDYDDLTVKTLELLQNPESMGWVSYTLYQSLDHILVDEAQDNSVDQWNILKHLIEIIIQNSSKTVFIVGDPKQSIYKFQGANLETFFDMKTFLKTYCQNYNVGFDEIVFSTSFRSTMPILSAVNHTFKDIGLTPESFPMHFANHTGGGIVELWPLFPKDSSYEDLAEKWCCQIDQWIKNPFFLETEERYLEAKDIMILLPRRTAFFEILQSKLSEKGLLVGGERKPMAQKAIQDLVNLGKWLVHPEDDSALAAVLNGSLLRCPQETLFNLAYKRGETSLWTRIQQQPMLDSVKADLCAWRTLLGEGSPFSMFYTLLYPMGGCKRMIKALSPNAREDIDDFLKLFYEFEEKHDLASFLSWMESNPPVLKKTFNASVQLLTIHGAKGLQSPVVVLPDLPPPAYDGSKAEHLKDQNEYWRLLYVAMTRAKERLYISSKHGKGWYATILKTMEFLGTPFNIWEDSGYRYGECTKKTYEFTPQNVPSHILLPEWAKTSFMLKSSAPCEIIDFVDLAKRNLGKILHQLINELPHLPSHKWASISSKFLKNKGIAKNKRRLWANRLAVLLARADLYAIFFKSKREVELCANNEVRRIDCLIEGPGDIWIVDFKSDERIETDWTKNPYQEQIAHYEDLLYILYPNHRLHKGLLWLSSGWLQWAPGSSPVDSLAFH